jgi:protein-S-isoprenylcysteine O-methyltransferase Ste14
MKPPPFLWPDAIIFWTVYVWALFPEMRIIRRAREEARRAESKDSGSLRVMTTAISLAMVIAFPLAFVERLSFPVATHRLSFAAGIVLVVLGSLLRRYCWKTLGEYFTGDVQVRSGQPVIRTGPYRLVRHPSYTGGILMNAGVGLALCSWLTVALLTATAIGTYAYRVTIEERALLDTLGEPYRAYMRVSKRFVPYIV